MNRRAALAAVLLAFVGVGCGKTSADNKEAAIVNEQQAWYGQYQPVPFYSFSLTRKLLTDLYTAQNEAVGTYTYVQSEYTGKVLWSCPSIGYPIPMGTQLTNGLKLAGYVGRHPDGESSYWSDAIIQQAEPNGTFSPATGSGTWIMCVGSTGKVWPRYEEKLVTTSPVPLVERDGQLVEAGGAAPSFEIDPARPANIPAAPNAPESGTR